MKFTQTTFGPKPGLILYAVSVLIPLFWIFSLENDHKFSALFSQYLGIFALITMGYVQLLATRLPLLERLFGGLDRIYIVHKWLAITALATLLLHENIDAEVISGTRPLIERIALEVGEIGYNGILILSIITALTFIPYHWWKWTHRFIGLFFAMGVFHFINIHKAFVTTDPIGLYVLFFCIIGIASYIYTLFFRQRITGYHYKVNEVRQINDIVEIKFLPTTKRLRPQSGQFAFVKFLTPGLGEIHPFTISKYEPDSGEIQFSIKSLGSYTAKLSTEIKPNTEAIITGPFGRFNLNQDSNPQIWVAGGIGITPFLAFMSDSEFSKIGPTTLYYCVREKNKVPYLNELTETSKQNENFNLVVVNSSKGERLNAELIIQEHKKTLSESIFYFCGPSKMRNQLRKKLVDGGLKRSNFKFEAFEIRTGIGIRRGFDWFREQIKQEINEQQIPSNTSK